MHDNRQKISITAKELFLFVICTLTDVNFILMKIKNSLYQAPKIEKKYISRELWSRVLPYIKRDQSTFKFSLYHEIFQGFQVDFALMII